MPTAKRREAAAEELMQSVPMSTAEAVIDVQAAVVRDMDRLSQSWIKRRMEALEEARRMMNEMRQGRDTAVMMTAPQNWIASAASRLLSDLGDLQGFAFNCMSRAGEGCLAATRAGQGAVFEAARAGMKPGATEYGIAAEDAMPMPSPTD